MRARDVKRLRKVVAKFKAYYVKSSNSLFGDFQDGQPIGTLVFALNPHHAIRRYMKRYYRMYKEQHRFYRKNYAEVTRDWGRVRVMTCDGYKRYYM